MKLAVSLLLLSFCSLNAQQFTEITKSVFTHTGNSTVIPFDLNNDGNHDVFSMGKNGSSYFSKLYKNNGDSSFLDLGISIPGLAYGDADIADYNNDGFQDIFICGYDGANKHFHLYRNLHNNLFQEIATGIPGTDYSKVKCADINKDGLIDVVLMGQSSATKIFNIYKNNGNGTFSLTNSLEGLYDGSFQIFDVNNDSYPDIVATGVNNSYQIVSKIYIHSHNDFNFTERVSNIMPTRGGSLSYFDFNNDGSTDILITGNNSNDEYVSYLYRNNEGLSFTLFSQLQGLYYSNSLTADFNNDGYPDIILSGVDVSSQYRTIYYINNSGTGFTEQITNIPDAGKGFFSPFDLTNDNRLDVLVSGYSMASPVTGIFNNELISQNSAPATPQNLTSFSQNDSVILRWNKASDAQTPADGLTYDFYIVSESEELVFSAPADFNNGKRHVLKQGQLKDTFVVIKNMYYGKYFWSVQAVDQSLKGSSFAARGEFNICHSLDVGPDTSACYGGFISLSAGNPSDVVEWYLSENPTVPYYTGNTASFEILDTLKVRVNVSTSIGCMLSDSLNVFMLPLPEQVLKSDTSVCFGSDISLYLNQDVMGDWSSNNGSVAGSGVSVVNFEVMYNDSIFVKMTDNNGCINYDSIEVISLSLPESFLVSDTSVCYNTMLTLNAGTQTDSVSWTDSIGAVLSGENILTRQIIESGYFSVRLIDLNRCVSYDTIFVVSNSLPIVNAGKDSLLCPGGSLIIGPDEAQENNTYRWTPSMYLNSAGIARPIATPENNVQYILEITDQNLCINYDSVNITVNPQSIVNTGGDKYICPGQSVLLGGDPTAIGSLMPYNYVWTVAGEIIENNANPTVTPGSTTQYTLIITTGNCIVDTDYVTVTILPLPVVTISDDIVIGYTESTELLAEGGSLYRWFPETGLDDSSIPNPVATPDETTLYTVYVTDSNGCESSAQVKVTIENMIFVPNLFTPNGDGKNDNFLVYGNGIAKILLTVYSPEGIMVFETSDVEEATQIGWDGVYHGKPMAPGKYMWKLEAVSTNGTPLLFNNSNKGIITLLK